MKKSNLLKTTALACGFGVLVSSMALAEQPQPIDIPSQPLADAIAELGTETGLNVAASADAVEGKVSTAVQGQLTPMGALQQLLQGTGLSLRAVGESGAVVSRTLVSQNNIEQPFFLGTLVLQGQIRDVALQDTSTSVVVATGEELERRGDISLYNLVNRTPNISSLYDQKGFAIRGIDQNGSGGSFNDLLVSTQVDGVALPSALATFFGPYSTWDLEQVEILRGPQSTQQGRNALAGAVIIRSKDPSYEPEYKFRIGAGSRDTREYALVANTPLLDDRLAFRFAASRKETDGWISNPTLDKDDYNGLESTSYRAKLRWDPSENFYAVLSYSNDKSYGGEDYVSADDFPSNYNNYSNLDATEGSRHELWGLRTRWDISPNMYLESETTYYEHDYERFEDIDNTAADQGYLSGTGHSEVFEQDIKLSFDTGSITGAAGLFYTKIKDSRPFTAEVDLGRFSPLLAGVVDVGTNDTRFEVENTAIFGEVDIRADAWLDGLSFTLGARYDRERFSFETEADYSIGLVGSDVPYTTGSNTYDAFLPKLSVSYEYAPEQLIALTYQRGYRSGGSMVNIASGTLYDYDPEFTDNFELSYLGSFMDDRVRSRANLFYMRWKDQQVQFSEGLAPPLDRYDFYTSNAGESELYGLELALEADVSDSLSLYGQLGTAKSRYIDFIDGGVDYSGNAFISAPEMTAALGGQYSWANGLSLSTDVSYTSGVYTDLANTTKTDDSVLVNSQLTYTHPNGLELGLYVRNLLDESYITHRLPDSDLIRTGEPRTIGVYATKTF